MNSSYILREVLLLAYGIDSDIDWDSSGNGISAIDLQLFPPSASSLILKIKELGKIYLLLESLTSKQQDNPYFQALFDSVDNYLDKYRDAIVQCDYKIRDKLITTLTGLIAQLEPYQFELQYFGRIMPSLVSSSPISLLNQIHEHVVLSPPSISQTFQTIEHAIHQVAIYQLTGYMFYHQTLPDLFEFKPNKSISYAGNIGITFLPHQFAELLLLIVNLTSKHDFLFEKILPPEIDQLNRWIASMAITTSSLLADQLKEQWPPFYRILSVFILFEDLNYISAIAKRKIQGNVTAFDLNQILSRFHLPKNLISIEIPSSGIQLKFTLKPPLSLIVNEDHQKTLSDFFKIFISMETVQLALNDLWKIKTNDKKTTKILFKTVSILQTMLSRIWQYFIFTVITPSIIILEKAAENINDYLKFQTKFTTFIMKMKNCFSTFDGRIQEGMDEINKGVEALHHLLIQKNIGSVINEEDLKVEVQNLGKLITENIEKMFGSSKTEELELKKNLEMCAHPLKLLK